MSDDDWDDTENGLIVADYFAMLTDELAGRPFNKSEHRRNLLELLPKRNNSALEFKHRNISAVIQPRSTSAVAWRIFSPLPVR